MKYTHKLVFESWRGSASMICVPSSLRATDLPPIISTGFRVVANVGGWGFYCRSWTSCYCWSCKIHDHLAWEGHGLGLRSTRITTALSRPRRSRCRLSAVLLLLPRRCRGLPLTLALFMLPLDLAVKFNFVADLVWQFFSVVIEATLVTGIMLRDGPQAIHCHYNHKGEEW